MPEHQPQADRTRATLPGSSSLSAESAAVLDAIIDADAEHPVKQRVIAERTGLSQRTVQEHLKTLCEEHGIPVVSRCRPPYGCFVAESPQEAEDYIAQLRARATSCFKRIRALSAAAARDLVAEHQQELFGGDAEDLRVARCPQCRETYEPGRSTQVYCSPDCRYDAARERGSI